MSPTLAYRIDELAKQATLGDFKLFILFVLITAYVMYGFHHIKSKIANNDNAIEWHSRDTDNLECTVAALNRDVRELRRDIGRLSNELHAVQNNVNFPSFSMPGFGVADLFDIEDRR